MKPEIPISPSLLGQEVVIAAAAAAEAATFAPHPAESALLSPQCSAKRRREFLMGRLAASRALVMLGFNPPPPVLRGPEREPLWPPGVVGSITHAGGFGIAAAGRIGAGLRSVGIDLERADRQFTVDVKQRICASRAELDWIEFGEGPSDARVILMFSAKEAGFKALFPLCRRQFGFSALALRPLAAAEFEARATLDLAEDLPMGFTFRIGYTRWQDYILTYSRL